MLGADVTKLVDELAQQRGPLPRSEDVPTAAGIYVVSGTSAALRSLALGSAAAGVLYVGRGDPSLRRRFAEEWRPKNSGRSSPRRTLGALLQSQLKLTAVPRRDRNAARGARYYGFADEGEARLTDWCDRYLEFAAALCPRGTADSLETALVALLKPPLNLTKWPNPDAPRLRALRRRLEQEALIRARGADGQVPRDDVS